MSDMHDQAEAVALAARASAGRRDRGFVLVPVLWMLMLLAVLAAIFAAYLGNSAMALSANDLSIEVEAAVSASLELAAWQLIVPRGEKRPSTGTFRVRVGHAEIGVQFTSEASRVDLNAAAKPLLSALFAVLGAPRSGADVYADRIIGWRTEADPKAQNDEASLYRAAGLSYGPRGGPFAHVEELWLVQGLPPALVERALPYVTVYSGQPTIFVAGAPPEVLAALPNMTPERLNDLLDRRDGTAGSSTASPTGQAGTTTDPGNTFRVTTRVAFDNGRRAAAEAVILVDNDSRNVDRPFHVLSWRENLDLAPGQPRAIAGVR
jgi:general secretion pathway protein K